MLYAFEGIPSTLRSGDVEKILAVTRQDCTQKGIRDYAILMLISKYGIRSGEIATLRLDDVDWRRKSFGFATVRLALYPICHYCPKSVGRC